MDPSLAKKRLAALILCNPASGKLRDSNDSVIKALNVEDGLNDAYKAWEKLGGCYSANESNIDGDLINVASMAKSPEDAFLYLYSYYQVLWTKAKAPLDLLKRSYAASAIAGSNNFLRVTFKISSVQDMIANSRKTSDLWAGSYLGSLLAWQTLLPIIENYGQSSVLSPFIGANPLYVYYVYEKLSDPNLKKELSKFAKNILELDLSSQLPVNALLPAKADLLIPDYGKNISDINQEIETYYKNAWRDIYNILKGYIQNESKFNTLLNMEGLLDEAAEWPPFPVEEVSVEQVTVDDLIKGNKQENGISKWQRIWVDYGYGLASSAQTATEKLYQEGHERYKYCTTCGINIAAVELTENGISEPLCPYCAAKRVLPDILHSVLKGLGFWVPDNVKPLHWPSTATLAGAEALIKALEKGGVDLRGNGLREKVLKAEKIVIEKSGDVEKTLHSIRDYKTHYYILRGDTDNAGENFSDNSKLEKYIGLSRDFALMALASVKAIEKNGGFVVYSGGDDLSAIFPNVGEVPVVINALIELIKPCHGNKEQTIGNEDYKISFNVYNDRKESKKKNPGNYIIHCRSYSILAAHSKDPLSVAWKMSGDLIESKDYFTWQKEGDDLPTAKNVVFILRGSGHIESLRDMEKEAALLPAISEVWSENGALPTLLGLRGKCLAKGVAHDALREIDMYGIYKEGSGKEWETLSLKVLEMILKRSELNKNAASEALQVLEPLKSVKAKLNGANEKLKSSNERQTIVSWEVLKALSHLR